VKRHREEAALSAHDTYEAAIKSAEAAKLASIAAAEVTRQLSANPTAASAAKLAALFQAEQAKQSALMVARDALRTAGDYSPF
jgi:hypothetical protein